MPSVPILSPFIYWSHLVAAFLFSPRYKLLLLKCGIIFHFSIMLIHGYSFLFFVMSAALFLYLYPAKKSFSLRILNEQQLPPYNETHSLEINKYLLFYVYVFAILIIANVLPVSQFTYFLFLFLGVAGVSLLVIKFTYTISIKKPG